ncbi:MAG: methylenetetrahydrofolate reductase [NAD(P)H] [Candidatus Sumerlaeaceae bacterium]|nr:methylenetetrahydrofolate reductase [NAD(P)H] [Candidatus Sumerlaeaceae bacterium]
MALRLREIFQHYRPAISIEFFPPKSEDGDRALASKIEELRVFNPAFCSITYGAGGSTRERTLLWARRLRHQFGLETMCHLTCVGHSQMELRRILEQLRDDGIENVMALRGDPPRGVDNWQPHPDGFSHAIELVRLARSVGEFGIGVAGFPEVHPEATSPEDDLRHLKAKVDAGADVVVTQLFYDNADYWRFVDNARRVGINVPIVPGILPFRSVAQLEKFTTVYARTFRGPARVPEHLRRRLSNLEHDAQAVAKLGIDYATEQCRELLEKGAPGIHFYCLNESDAVSEILRNLQTTWR